jgi:hypothetical protein
MMMPDYNFQTMTEKRLSTSAIEVCIAVTVVTVLWSWFYTGLSDLSGKEGCWTPGAAPTI